MSLMLPEPWETGKAANAVLRYAASPRHPSRNPAERQGAVPWTTASPSPVRGCPRRGLEDGTGQLKSDLPDRCVRSAGLTAFPAVSASGVSEAGGLPVA